MRGGCQCLVECVSLGVGSVNFVFSVLMFCEGRVLLMNKKGGSALVLKGLVIEAHL